MAGGADGLWHKVTWVARMLPRPPGFGGFKGGELALLSTSSMKMLDERLTLTELIRRLTEKGVVGVAALGEASREAAALADETHIPLLILPESTNLYEVEQAVTRLIIEQRAALYQRSQEIFTQLTELAIEGKGVPAILRKLSSITGKAVAMEGEDLRLELFVPGINDSVDTGQGSRLLEAGREDLLEWAKNISPGSSEPPFSEFHLTSNGFKRLVAPISTKERVWGFLSILGTREGLTEADKLAITNAAAACAIEIARDRAVLDAQDRLQSDFIEDLLTGSFPNAASMIARGKRLGYALNPPYAVLAFDTRDKRKELPGWESSEQHKQLSSMIELEASRLDQSYLFRVRDNTLILLVPVGENVEPVQLKKLVEGIRSRLAAHLKHLNIAVGVGRVHPDLEGIKTAYQEARQSLGMGLQLFGEGCLSYFGDLGIYRLLFNLHGTPDLHTFYDEVLGKLLEYDQRNGAELVKTLQAYFAACGSLTDAAQKLHLHRNTLLYRLHRVREISGLDLEDPETRLAIQLALRIGDTLHATSITRP